MKIEYIIEEDNILIKEYLQKIGLSRRLGRKIKLYGAMYINNIPSKNYYELKKGDVLTLEYTEKTNDLIVAKDEEIDICYEDEYLLIVNKRANLCSQPSKKHFNDNLLSFAKGYIKDSDPHLVNRLDYQTSGLVILSKEGYVHSQFKNIVINKKYLCICHGIFDVKEDTIILPIKRICDSDIKREVNNEGKEAITKYKVIKEFDNKSLVEVEILTGRTHQIRVHLSYLKHPIVGDKLYGIDDNDLMMLHAYYLSFIHFKTKKKIEIIKYPKWY